MHRLRHYYFAAPVFVFLLIGLLIAHYPMFLTGFKLVSGSPDDNRLIHYILEHTYLWSGRVDSSLWSPPMFYPALNTGGYTDILLGIAPFYWIWRVLNIDPDSAFQLWILTVSALNFIFAYLLFSKGFGFNSFASAAGAFLFCFSSSRLNKLTHLQLLGHFYIAIAIYALFAIFRSLYNSENKRRNTAWIVAFALLVTIQLYASYYFGWFLAMFVGIAALWALVVPSWRKQVVYLLRDKMLIVYPTLIVTALLLAPMIVPYLQAAEGLEARNFTANVLPMIPRPQSWVYLGTHNVLYGSLFQSEIFKSIPNEWEQRLGLGLITSIAAVTGLYIDRRRTSTKIIVLVTVTVILLVTLWPGEFTLWRYIFDYVPGASAIRAVSRIGLFLLIPASLGVAALLDLLTRSRKLTAILIAAVLSVWMVGEQIVPIAAWDKQTYRQQIDMVVSEVNSDCKAFFYTPTIDTLDYPWFKYQLDAMWASLELRIPTVNGYSGNQPPGITFREEIFIRDESDKIRLEKNLKDWLYKMGDVPPATVCWIT